MRGGRDHAISSVPAVVVLVTISVVLGAVSYATFSQFKGEGGAPPAISFSQVDSKCATSLRVAGAQGTWNELKARVEGTNGYALRAGGLTVRDAPWDGASLASPKVVTGGDDLDLSLTAPSAGSLTLIVTHAASNTVVSRSAVREPQTDTTPPTTGISLPSVISSFSVVPGTASDACGKVESTRVALQRVSDNWYHAPGGFQATAHWYTALGDTWSVDLGGGACALGQYRALAIPKDLAGNEGTQASVTVDCLPAGTAFDPGYAYQDHNHDFLYTPGVDTPIDNATIRTGLFSVPGGRGLVIPPLVGPINNPSGKIEYTTTGAGHITVAVPLTAQLEIKLTAGQDVRIPNMTLRSNTEKIELLPARAVYANGATLDSVKEIKLDTPGKIEMNATTFTSSTEKITVKSSSAGRIYLFNSTITASKLVEINSVNGHILGDDARITSSNEKIDVLGAAAGGEASFRRAILQAKTSMTVDVRGHHHFESSSNTVTSGPLIFKVGSTSYTIYVGAATIDDDNNVAKAEPSGVPISGAPASGTINYSG